MGTKPIPRTLTTTLTPNGDDEARFVVELSNSNFSYNPVNNQVTVKDASGEIKQSCEMKIIWKDAPLSGSSEVLSRTIMLNWSNEANAATIEFESNSGSAVQMIRLLAGTVISNKMPPAPTRLGYTFIGWYTDENLNNLFTATTMPAGNTKLYAKWSPNTVSYTVDHYQQALDGQYVLVETDNTLSGMVGTQTSAVAKTYEGFTEKDVKQQTIAADGSTQVGIYYNRNFYSLKFVYGSDNVVTAKVPYGSAIVKPLNPVKQGYVFKGWSDAIPDIMPAKAQTFIAQWEENTDTVYTVKHIRQNLDGTYPTSGDLVKTELLTGIAGQVTNAVAKTYTGFTAQTVEQKTIASDGGTVVEILYTRNSHSLTWNVNGGEDLVGNEYTNGVTKYGMTIIKPGPVRTGYTFGGWYKDADMTVLLEDNAKMPDTALTLTAKWNGPQSNYTVKHIRQTLDGSYPTSGDLVEIESLTGITGQSTSATAITYTGFTAQAFDQETIASDGSTMVEILYTRNTYTVRFYGAFADGTTENLNLIGENKITGVDSDASSYGIRCDNLTIEGDGSLTVVSGKGSGSMNESSAVLARNITINSGTLNLSGERSGLYVLGKLAINGGTITAQGGTLANSRAIWASDSQININTIENNIIMVGDTEPGTAWTGDTYLTDYKYFHFEKN